MTKKTKFKAKVKKTKLDNENGGFRFEAVICDLSAKDINKELKYNRIIEVEISK